MWINNKENYNNIRDSITIFNLNKTIDSKDYLIIKVAINSNISGSTVKYYINSQKIPSLPTLIYIADFLNCNITYLVDKTYIPTRINVLEKPSNKS